MHIIQEEIGVPKTSSQSLGDFHTLFTISAFPNGFGVTLGNALRRVLLASLPGVAVTGVKIKGITHEYTVPKGCKESVLDIALNLKQLALSMDGNVPMILHLKAKKAGPVTAADIEVPSGVTVHNPDLYISSLEKGSSFEMEIRIEKGVGFRPVVLGKKDGADSELIEVDAIFSPLKKIHYSVENMRVGQRTDLDKLMIEIKTNGSLEPDEALRFASELLTSYFGIFTRDQEPVEPDFISDFDKIAARAKADGDVKPKQETYTPIEILSLSPRTLNALINGGIGSIEQLTKCTESKLNNLRGFGRKALNEVAAALEKRGLSLTLDS